MAYLFGKSIKERALAMIEIAHPSFRSWLLDEAKKLGYVRPDQGLKSRVAYPVREEREITLKNGRRVTIRPSRASDVKQLQDVFYRLSEEDVYTRFFRQLESLSVSEAEHLCNVDYETEMAFVALAGEREDEQIIAGSCYFLNPTTNIAEVAYMVLPEWQSSGVGGALQERMTEYAKKKGCSGFVAEILSSNSKMIALARKAGEQVDIRRDGGTCEVTVLF